MAFVLGDEFMHVDPRRAMSVPSCSVRYFCLGALLIFVGSVLLCALGFTIVLPHEATRDWPLTVCQVLNSTYDTDHCSCDKHPAEWDQCVLKYPCLQVRVLYDIPETLNSPNITMVDDRGFGMLYRYWSDAFYQTCALYECGDEEWNVREVKRFRLKFGTKNQEYKCFIDPDDPFSLILERTPTSSMIHAILWPSLSLFIGLIIWLGLCCGCWKIEIKDKNANRTPGRYGLL